MGGWRNGLDRHCLLDEDGCRVAVGVITTVRHGKKLLKLYVNAVAVLVMICPVATAFGVVGGNRTPSLMMKSQVVDTPAAAKSDTQNKPPPISAQGLVGIPLSRWRREQANRYPEAREMEQLMGCLAEAVKAVAGFTRVAGVPDYKKKFEAWRIFEEMGEGRRHNEVASRLCEVALQASGKLGVVAYNGKPPTVIDEGFGHFIATVNPLVGAGGLDAGVATGTVIGVFDDADVDGCIVDYDIDEESAQEEMCLLRTLQPKNLVGAAYSMYGSRCDLVLAVKGEGVHRFTLDPHIGEFILTTPYLKMPKRGAIYSLDESRRDTWKEPLAAHIDKLQAGRGESGEKYAYRFMGSTVGDVHRTLTKGGFWGRPDTDVGADLYGGDRTGGLVVLGEASPLAFIIEQAGGRAVDGRGKRVLDIVPKALRQKTGVFLGSQEDIEELERALR